MEIELPKGMTQKDLEAFLKYYQNQSHRPKRTKDDYPDYCSECIHWHSKETDIRSRPGWTVSGYCKISCECPTEIFNHKTPSRFISRQEVKVG